MRVVSFKIAFICKAL